MSSVDLKQEFINKAKSFDGTTEHGGDNKGPQVEAFQKAYDGKAQEESWCLAYIDFCIRDVEARFGVPCGLSLSEHCMTFWNTNPVQRRQEPKPGYIAIWKKKGTNSGHAGVVTAVTKDQPPRFHTMEGNTGPGAGIEREGDGVYAKLRGMAGMGDMVLMGFIEPWC